jgi:hypothetical protein
MIMMIVINAGRVFINPAVSMENEMHWMPKNDEIVRRWIA